MSARPKPILLNMVICDQILQDVRTGKKSLIGIFNRIHSHVVPFAHKLDVFVSLTEGNGTYSSELKCLKADTNEVIAKLNGPIELVDPHDILEVNFVSLNLIFPSFGNYRFEFMCNDTSIGFARFEVLKIQNQGV